MLTRIAPTPSGYLHIGNIYNFLICSEFKKIANAKITLRIDDSDSQRVRDAYIEDVFFCLDYLKIEIDEGPSGIEDFKKYYSQINKKARYKRVVESLEEKSLLFACSCSRQKLRAHEGPCSCKEKGEGFSEACALRINSSLLGDPDSGSLALDFLPKEDVLVDFVVQKKDSFPSYQVVSLCEDEDHGITHIFRGKDLVASSFAQKQLAHAVGYQKFLKAKVFHHELLLNEGGAKLSKSTGAPGFSVLCEKRFPLAFLRKKAQSYVENCL